jgi:hypothetical protein
MLVGMNELEPSRREEFTRSIADLKTGLAGQLSQLISRANDRGSTQA